MLQIHSGLKATMSNFLKTGSLGEGAKPTKAFMGDFMTAQMATTQVFPLFNADQVDGVDIASAPNQVEISPDALKNNPDFAAYSGYSRVRCEFVGPKEDPDEVTFHTQSKESERLSMVKFEGKPDGSALIRYVTADSRENEVGWLIEGHEFNIEPGQSPFDAKIRSQGLFMNPMPKMVD